MKVLFPILIFFVTVITYFPSGKYELLKYDDNEYITDNPHVMGGLTGVNIRWAFNCGYAANWHPATWWSHMADVSLAGMNGSNTETRLPRIAHWHNIILHAVNAVLLWMLMMCAVRRASRTDMTADSKLPWICSALALLWSVHPLRVEVVCWASERKELLSCMWMLVVMLLWVSKEFVRHRQMAFQIAYYGLVLSAFALALMAKGVAVTLPGIMAAWELTMRRGVALEEKRATRILPWVSIGLAGVMSICCARFTMASQTEALDFGKAVPVTSKIATVIHAPIVYLRQTFWPNDLCLLYPQTETLSLGLTGGGIMLILGMVAISAWWLWRWALAVRDRTRPMPSLALDLAVLSVAWVYGGLVPMLGIVKVGSLEHSDRYTYWIGCGLCCVLAVAFSKMKGVWSFIKRTLEQESYNVKQALLISGVGVAIVIFALCVATRKYMPYWENTIVLFERALPNFWNINFAEVLNQELRKAGRDVEREKWLEEIVRRCPTADICLDYAYILLSKPQDSTIRLFGGDPYALPRYYIMKALELDPKSERALKFKLELEKIDARHKAN